MDIINKMREARIAAGLSQKDVADALNTSSTYISNIERGIRTPSVITVIKYLNAVGADMEVFRRGNPKK